MVTIKGCSGIEGSGGPEWKGLRKGASLVDQKSQLSFQWHNKEGRVRYNQRCSSLVGEVTPQIGPYPVIKLKQKGAKQKEPGGSRLGMTAGGGGLWADPGRISRLLEQLIRGGLTAYLGEEDT